MYTSYRIFFIINRNKLWNLYCKSKAINTEQERQAIEPSYFDDGTNRTPRYYQTSAINRVIEAVAKGKDRILLVMATGTG